jgi:pyruvate formate lyase activating enzyme
MVDEKTSCICFFGGDPSTQMPHALKTSREAMREAREGGRLLRICWETNGRWNPRYAEQAAELSLESGGNIKCDLKTWDESLNMVLCGTSNRASLESFRKIGETYYGQRPELPVLSASTLLIPGYVDTVEVEKIAEFIADVEPSILYTLLAFYPSYVLDDLPTTSRRQSLDCLKVARKHLDNVRIGNINLLSS